MATRNLLHKSHLEEFKEWLIKCGWQICEPKTIYEVLRSRRGGVWLIVYRKSENKEHYTVRDLDYSTVRRFLKDRRSGHGV